MNTQSLLNNSSIGLPENAIWFQFTPRARFLDGTGFPRLRRYLPADLRIMKMVTALHELEANITFYNVVNASQSAWFTTKDVHPLAGSFFCVEVVNPVWRGPRFLPRFISEYPDYAKARLDKASIFYASYGLRKRTTE